MEKTYLVLQGSDGKLYPEKFLVVNEGNIGSKSRKTYSFKEGESLVECRLVVVKH